MRLNPTTLFMTQKRRIKIEMIRESIRDKNSVVVTNTLTVINKMKRTIIYTLLGGTKKTSPNKQRKRGVRINTFLCLFIFSS